MNLTMRTRSHIAVGLIGIVFGVRGQAADGNVVASGYQLPQDIIGSPGQVITILLQGLTPPPQRLSAESDKWPLTLGGISATIAAATQTGPKTLAISLQSAFPFSNCAPPAGSCGTLTGLTLQIPFEILANSPGRLTPPLTAFLTVSDQAGHTVTALVNPLPDQIHVVRSYDAIMGGNGGGPPAVTHADGSAVSIDSPAKPGEVLAMYAVGLGSVTPEVPDGGPGPASPLATTQTLFRLNYDTQANASPSPGVSQASTGDPPPPLAPLFVGLAPGFVGLYQVDFLVPSLPAGTLPCGGPVASNLTVTLVGGTSFDGAGLCVAVNGS